MEKARATDAEILARLTKLSVEKNVVLTYTHKIFFLRLVDYAIANGIRTVDGFSLSLTVEKIAEVLDVPLRTTIQSLNRLSACGALQRTDGEKTFPRSPTVTMLHESVYRKSD